MEHKEQQAHVVISDPFLVRAKRRVQRWMDQRNWYVAEATLNLRRERRIKRICADAEKEFAALQTATQLKVHLGCGPDVREGWLNVDLRSGKGRGRRSSDSSGSAPEFINHDLRRGLPLREGCATYVYSSHFFEHLDYEQGFRLMKDCHRALEPSGVFRIVLPDFRKMAEAYARGDARFFEPLDPGIATRVDRRTQSLVDYVNYWVYQYGEHRFIYDPDKLSRICRTLGYTSFSEGQFDDKVDLEQPERRLYSFYFEAIK